MDHGNNRMSEKKELVPLPTNPSFVATPFPLSILYTRPSLHPSPRFLWVSHQCVVFNAL